MKNQKIILLLADGMRPDFMLSCGNPFVGELLANSRYTLTAQTVMPSMTLPCHMSLFHSVLPERHGILTNTYTPQVRPINGICEVLHAAGKKCGILYDWEQLRDLTRPNSLDFSYFTRFCYDNSMNVLTEETLRQLNANKLDFIFLYIGLPDIFGHDIGFESEEYRTGIGEMWNNIRQIAHAANENDYALIVTADHGGHGRTHGTDLPEDMTIPLVFHGNVFDNLSETKLQNANITDIAPTILQAMGVESDSDWNGGSLY